MCTKKVLTPEEEIERDRLVEELSILIVQQRNLSLEIIRLESQLEKERQELDLDKFKNFPKGFFIVELLKYKMFTDNLKQRGLAKVLDISENRLSEIMNFKREMNADFLAKLHVKLKMNASFLLKFS